MKKVTKNRCGICGGTIFKVVKTELPKITVKCEGCQHEFQSGTYATAYMSQLTNADDYISEYARIIKLRGEL